MTDKHRDEIISQIIKLVNEIAYDKDLSAAQPAHDKVKMLTIKECTEAVRGLSEHSIRQLVAQSKIPYIRAGQGKRGKILINKADLLYYVNSS